LAAKERKERKKIRAPMGALLGFECNQKPLRSFAANNSGQG